MIPDLAEHASEQALGLPHRVLLHEDRNAPLVFLVHGRAGDSKVMWAFRRSVPAHWHIVSVQAPIPDPLGGFSWWLVDGAGSMEDRARAGAEPLRRLIERFCGHYDLRPSRRLALGFSQGGALLSYVVQDSPLLFSGLGLLASFVVSRTDVPAEPLHGAPPVFIAHGSEDTVVPLARSMDGRRYLEERGFPVEHHIDPVGHKVGSSAMRALPIWLERVGSGHD